MKNPKVAVIRWGDKCVISAFALMAVMSVFAGVKYWDNPDFKSFDVGDYVQDGLVVNYDGIRNQGPDASHDSAAMTWVNCANPGTYDMTRYSTNGTWGVTNIAVVSGWNNDAARGSWTDKGFVFNKDACFHQPSSFAIPKTYTIQSLVDAKTGEQTGDKNQIGYIMCPYSANNWAYCSYGLRSSGYNYGGGNVNHTFYLVSGSIGKRPAVRGSSAIRFSYMTAIQNSNDAVIFSDTEAPWSATYSPDTSYGHAYDSTKQGTAYTYSNGFCIGGHYPRTDEMFKGTVRNYRFYNRCLSDTEVLWNRVVDEARYFGRGREITVIPVTNVVESFTIAGVRDYHYAIDAEGQTFTAPSSKTVNGKRHVLSGYTLSTWNGSDWGAPITHNGEFSYTATDPTALVRLTWQYAAASGEGALKTYDVNDYVAGAAVHFDGIRNAGATADHDPNATTWVNLGTAGSAINMSRTKYGYGDLGGWDGDGYWFTDTPKFTSPSGAISWPATYSVQVLLDANTADQQRNDTAMYIYSVSWNRLAMAIYGKRGELSLQTQKEGAQPYGVPLSGTSFQYVNGFVDSNAKKSAIFSSTTIPESGSNVKSYETMDTAVGSSGIGVGGFGGDASQDLVGKIKSLRFYFNKVLTEEELAQNRKVDEYRFFGRYVVTNVLVQSTYSYLQGNEKAGPYEVEGSYTFTAPETVAAPNGITYACAGYTVETQDGIGWATLTSGTGNSYLYNASAGTVRLTWKWKATSGIRTAADYSIDDLSPAGLALHYDGIFNQGVGVERSTTSTTWVNLGLEGAAYDLTLNKGSDNSTWGDYGYFFAGKSRFSQSATRRWGPTLTVQVLIDAEWDDLQHASSANYIFGTAWNACSLTWYKSEGRGLEFHTQSKPSGSTHYGPYCPGTAFDFANITLDATAKQASIFTGTTVPTDPSVAGCTAYDAVASNVNGFNLGGWGGGTSQYLVGTVKNFRYYDRVLTEEELVRNRNVDSARYFGELGVTNVFVVAGGEGAVQTETGAYKVEGKWTFTATKAVGKDGSSVEDVIGCYISKFVDGRWSAKEWHDGASYTYDESAENGAVVRIDWRSYRDGMMVIIK